MAMSMRRATQVTSSRTPATRLTPASRARVVQVRADWVSEAWMRVFTPNKSKVPAIEPTAFTGSASRGRRPFKDGFSAAPSKAGGALPASKQASAAKPSASSDATAAAPADAGGPLAYLGAALRSVVGNNFTSEVDGKSTGASGWKGNVRQKGREDKGFHSNMY